MQDRVVGQEAVLDGLGLVGDRVHVVRGAVAWIALTTSGTGGPLAGSAELPLFVGGQGQRIGQQTSLAD